MGQAGECGLRPGLGGRAGVVGGLARLKVPALEIRANDQLETVSVAVVAPTAVAVRVIVSVVNGLAATIIVRSCCRCRREGVLRVLRQAGECDLRPGLGGRAGVVGGLARLKVPALEIRANDQVGNGQGGGGGATAVAVRVIVSW